MVVWLLMVWTCSAATGTFACGWQPEIAAWASLHGCRKAQVDVPGSTCQPVLVRP
jgi:hypothetical protein